MALNFVIDDYLTVTEGSRTSKTNNNDVLQYLIEVERFICSTRESMSYCCDKTISKVSVSTCPDDTVSNDWN